MKKKIYKRIALLMAAVVTVFMIAGCSMENEGDSKGDTSKNSSKTDLAKIYDSVKESDDTYVEVDQMPEAKADKTYTIGCAMTNVSTGWFKALYDNLKKMLEDSGCKVLLVECNDDANTQVNQIETFIAQKVDGIIINPANPQETVTTVLNQACDAGIPVVAVDVPPEEGAPYLTASVTDAYKLGYMFGEELAKKLLEKNPEGEIPYGLIGGTDGNSIAALRNEGARDAIKDIDKDGRIVEEAFLYAGAYSEESGLETAQNMLAAHQDLKCIIGTCDAHIVGATSAAKQLGLDKNLIMGAVDGSKGAYEIMKDNGPIVALGLNSPNEVGEVAGRALLGYLNDGTLPESKTLKMEPTLVTPDNVDEYYDPDSAF